MTALGDDGIASLVGAIRHRWPAVVACLLMTLGAATAYLLHTDRMYEAHAEVLVQPVASDGTERLGLGLLRETGDPARPLQTVARLIRARAVAERVRRDLGLTQTAEEILRDIEAQPVAQSSIVDIAAREPSPAFARDLANAFGRGIVADRTQRLHDELDALIARLAPPTGHSGGPGASAARLAELRALRAGDDPTIRLVTLASTPTSPVSPRPLLALLAAFLAGLVLGGAVAVTLERFDPLLRRPDQVPGHGTGPVLAEVPRRRRRGRDAAWETFEAFRALRLALAPVGDGVRGSRVLLVTGTRGGVGTTTASGLGWSLAQAGERVILIEGDTAAPGLAQTGAAGGAGLVSVLEGATPLAGALRPVGGDVPLEVLGLGDAAGLTDHPLGHPRVRELLREARRRADWIVVDAPSLIRAPELLGLAVQADAVVVVARVGDSRLADLDALAEMLAAAGIGAAGTVVSDARTARNG